MARQRQPNNEEDWVPMLKVGPFGGVDTTTEPYYVSTSNFVDMVNLLPNAGYGGYVTAPGRKVFLSGSLPGTCKGMAKFSRPGTPNGYVFAVDIGTTSGYGALYYAQAGGTPVLLTLPAGASLTFGAQYFFVPFGQWIFLSNGIDTPLKIDMSLNVTYWGIVPPATAPTTMVAGVASTMVGTYYYTVTFGNASQESSQGFNDTTQQTVYSAALTTTDMGIALAGIPVSTDPQVTERNIYRLGGGNGTWNLVATISDNTTTTYVDTLADDAVLQTLTVFRDPPQPFTYICLHQERIWGFGTPSDPSIVYYSNLNEPWGFNNDTGNLPVGENSLNDIAVGMASCGSVLALHKSNSLYAVYGDSNSTFAVALIEYTGATSSRGIISAYGASWWHSEQGFYVWTGSSNAQNLSDGTFQKSNIKSILDNLNANDKAQAVCFVFDRMIGLSFPTLEMSYIYDTRTTAWFPISWAADQMISDINGLYKCLGQNLFSNGEIDQWFAAPGDFGNPITAYITSGITDSGSTNSTKDYRYVNVEAQPQDATLAIMVVANPGSYGYSYTTALDMSTGGPVFQFDLPMTIVGRACQLKVLVTSKVQVHVQSANVMGQIRRLNVEMG
jgi:hypothetical protein